MRLRCIVSRNGMVMPASYLRNSAARLYLVILTHQKPESDVSSCSMASAFPDTTVEFPLHIAALRPSDSV